MTTYIKIKASHLAENNKDQLEKYECPKCEHILTDAVQTSCGHWLCHDCADGIFQKMEDTPYCPRTDCGEELTAEEGRPFFPDRFVRKEISRFVVACINRKFGCIWEGKLGELGNHLRTCEHNKTECKHCNQAFSPLEYQSHVDQCPKMTVACPLKDHGCKETEEMSREECIEHVASKTGIYSHFLMIASILSSIVPSSSTDAQEGERRNVVESDGGYELMSKVRSASPKAIKRYVSTDGPAPRGNEFGFLEDGVAGAVGGYEGMGGGRLDDKLMSLVMTKITGIQAELTKKDSQIHTLQDKVAQLETTLSTKMSENEDRDFRLSLMENSNFDGSMVWKIPQFSQRMDDARTGKYTSIFSLPFYSSRYGYKMCLRLYILGDGIGKGTHMSLFFVVMKGEFDNILQWPFTHKVTFKLINQCGARDIMDIFQPDPLSSSFQKPKSDMNVASGCPRFVSMNELMQGGFIVDDTIFIKVKVDTATMRHP
ncbi:PREDICTED: TNF receptor-associated factor 2-like [Amphimedon queenslandica]|uniref:RING-type E3 ubiquitin transferase n=1 Tax=Amphimedon queenslandica TaxID=400682 RepID=A0A1X7UQ51_AMPQE|nr:PREDICTED: TNF receptor-associated factor 2-like [Amphimedon queenslandica]|eukprot:XP_019852875.1 PREDICTED: TNF receptor-associated factor 2-like [Amphimedon queenslandica]